MKLAETVTFGGSALDRAAELRSRPDEVARLREHADVLTLWRGKPLIDDATGGLHWLPHDHAAFGEVREEVFLGRDGETAWFARDISDWEPDAPHDDLGAFHDPSVQRHPSVSGAGFAELRARMIDLTPREAELVATAKGVLGWHETHGFCARCGAETSSAMAGWQRDCGACGGHHFPRTDPVVIMLILRGNSVLVGRSPGWPEGMYSLLAGFVEPGESIEAAVRREVFEEAGIRVGEVGYLSSQPWPFPSSLMFGCIGFATSDEIVIDPKEIEAAHWVTRERMMEIFAGRDPQMKAARKGAIARFLLENWLADTLD